MQYSSKSLFQGIPKEGQNENRTNNRGEFEEGKRNDLSTGFFGENASGSSTQSQLYQRPEKADPNQAYYIYRD